MITPPTFPRGIQAVLFDLDDTLYPERTFFESGFRVVARELVRRGLPGAPEILAQQMIRLHDADRSQVFDRHSAQAPFPIAWVPELIAIFRDHNPDISLPDSTAEVLTRLKKRFRIGCVTDGWTNVQQRKLAALGLQLMFDAVILADTQGRSYWKPHAAPFLRCCGELGVPPEAAVFIGDHPERDIEGARRAGLAAGLLTEHGTFHQQAVGDCLRFANLYAVADALLATELESSLQ